MSRVFDALRRAGEGKREIGESGGEHWGLQLSADAEEKLPPAFAEDNGSNGKTAPRIEAGPKSWRERVENVIFGWDLRRYNRYPIVVLEKDSPAAEQYKILREHVRSLRSEVGVQVLSITSPVKRDGKTTVASNLAAAMALHYEDRVLLIDADLRRPEAHHYFGLQLSPGLADYLGAGSNGDLTGYIQDTFIPGLQILPAGKPVALSSELLATEKMKSLMEEVRKRFPLHQIIVDAPPVLSTPDPLVLSKHVEGILMVIRAGKTPREYLSRALQSLNSGKVKGILLNGVELGISSKYYYRSKAGADH